MGLFVVGIDDPKAEVSKRFFPRTLHTPISTARSRTSMCSTSTASCPRTSARASNVGC
jgi:hypothetical protein